MPQVTELLGEHIEVVERDYAIVVHIKYSVHGPHLSSPEVARVGIFLESAKKDNRDEIKINTMSELNWRHGIAKRQKALFIFHRDLSRLRTIVHFSLKKSINHGAQQSTSLLCGCSLIPDDHQPYLLALIDVRVWVSLAITNIGARLLGRRSLRKSSRLVEDVWRFRVAVFVWTLQSARRCERLGVEEKQREENCYIAFCKGSWHKEFFHLFSQKCINRERTCEWAHVQRTIVKNRLVTCFLRLFSSVFWINLRNFKCVWNRSGS